MYVFSGQVYYCLHIVPFSLHRRTEGTSLQRTIGVMDTNHVMTVLHESQVNTVLLSFSPTFLNKFSVNFKFVTSISIFGVPQDFFVMTESCDKGVQM